MSERKGFKKIDTPVGHVYLPPASSFTDILCGSCGASIGGINFDGMSDAEIKWHIEDMGKYALCPLCKHVGGVVEMEDDKP